MYCSCWHLADMKTKDIIVKEWLVNGKRHRLDGPAIIDADGTQKWYQNDKRHRVDGPAIMRADGYQAWYQNGKHQGNTDGSFSSENSFFASRHFGERARWSCNH